MTINKDMGENGIQLEFPIGSVRRGRHDLVDFMNRGSPRQVEVVLTRNRVTMLSVVIPRDGAVRLRLHEHYLEAPDGVLSAIRTYIRTRRKTAWAEAAGFARLIGSRESPSSPPPRRTRGNVYDLKALFNRVNRRHFQGRLRCGITWGRDGSPRRKKGRRCILYGSYDRENNLVRIHPALDQARVPESFVEYIVFHELLHAAVPPGRKNGRTLHHGAAFKRLEKTFPEWDRMQVLAGKLLHIVDQPGTDSRSRF